MARSKSTDRPIMQLFVRHRKADRSEGVLSGLGESLHNVQIKRDVKDVYKQPRYGMATSIKRYQLMITGTHQCDRARYR